jgi:predicted ABC-type ATPase
VGRVAARVAQGGHNVAEAVIRRRFEAGWLNFRERYKPVVDAWALYDNSGDRPVLVEQSANP